MHDLPHLPYFIITPMHQFMFIFICMFTVFKQIKTLINKKGDKTKWNKMKPRDRDSRIDKTG